MFNQILAFTVLALLKWKGILYAWLVSKHVTFMQLKSMCLRECAGGY